MQHNLIIPKNHSIRKKVRGSRRKLRSFGRKLDSVLLSIPEESLPHDKSWRYHLPSPQKLVDSTNSSYKLRKRFLQLLADKLIELDGCIKGKYKTLLSISLPFLSQSRIDVCIDSKYFEKLLNNADAPTTWTPISPESSLIRALNLAMPTEYRAKGFFRNSADSGNKPSSKPREEKWVIWKDK